MYDSISVPRTHGQSTDWVPARFWNRARLVLISEVSIMIGDKHPVWSKAFCWTNVGNMVNFELSILTLSRLKAPVITYRLRWGGGGGGRRIFYYLTRSPHKAMWYSRPSTFSTAVNILYAPFILIWQLLILDPFPLKTKWYLKIFHPSPGEINE